MNILKKIFHRFVKWIQPEYRYSFKDELPVIVADKTIYIIGGSLQPWLLAFNCPCGCKKLIQLNLIKEASPCWKFKISNRHKISISPSIWATSGCKSHFLLKQGKVEIIANRNHKYDFKQKPQDAFF